MSDASRFRYRSYPISDVPRNVLEEALGRCAKRDRDLVLGWYDSFWRRKRDGELATKRHEQRQQDLSIVVRDQQAHIRNLEAQLLPYLQAVPDSEQEALL